MSFPLIDNPKTEHVVKLNACYMTSFFLTKIGNIYSTGLNYKGINGVIKNVKMRFPYLCCIFFLQSKNGEMQLFSKNAKTTYFQNLRI